VFWAFSSWRKVVAVVDDSIDEASADVVATLTDGRQIHVFVEHAIGSVQNPMTVAQLEAKFHGLSDTVLGSAATNGLLAACWKLGAAPDVAAIIRHATPAAMR
jgi:2-methylcitrate dehydratase PrpD